MSVEDVRHYAHQIETEWKASVAAVLSVAGLVNEASKNLNDEDWKSLTDTLGFSMSWVSKMKKIDECGRFTGVKMRRRLPSTWTLLWEYASLTDREWEGILAVETSPMPVSREATHSAFQKGLIAWREKNPSPNYKPLPGIRLPKGIFCGFTVPDHIDDVVKLEIKNLIDKIESKLYHLGVEIHYADAPTPLKANIIKKRQQLAEKLEKEWISYLHRQHKGQGKEESVEDIQILEDSLWQHRYAEENNRYPYDPKLPESIENKKHPFYVGKYSFKEIIKNLKTNYQVDKKNSKNYGGRVPLTSWTPIEDWLEFGEGKIIYWSLEHSRAINDKQRTYWKRKLDSYARWDKQYATIAKKYISMLVQG